VERLKEILDMNKNSLNDDSSEKNEYLERNRHKSFHSNSKSFGWCICDRAKIGSFGKCSFCGRKAKNFDKRRLKGF